MDEINKKKSCCFLIMFLSIFSNLGILGFFQHLSFLLGIVKHFLSSRHSITLRNFNGGDQLENKEDNLDAAYDGEPSEEPHGASDEAQLGLRLDLLVSLDVVEGRRVKVDLHKLQS